MDKFQNKYRIQSHRKPNWDYSADGLYFLTIVTQNRECNLGSVHNGEIILSDFGIIVEIEWFKSFEIRNELFLDVFVIMPNHIHTIVVLDNHNRTVDGSVNDSVVDDGNGTGVDTVETHGRASLQLTPSSSQLTPSPQLSSSPETSSSLVPNILNSTIIRNPAIRLPKSISSFIAGFKSAVNTKIDDYIDENKLTVPKYNQNNHFFQPNYHDHIIRNEWEYQYIQNYIANNPQNWDTDKFNTNDE